MITLHIVFTGLIEKKATNATFKKIIKYIFIILSICCAFTLVVGLINCELGNHPPTAPIYPESILMQVSSDGTQTLPIQTYKYSVKASPDKIINFYADRGRCGLHEPCLGEAWPIGEYFVYIDLESYESEGFTKYAVEIHWLTCKGEIGF